MADHVKEEIVARRNKAFPMFVYVLLTIVAVISAIIGAFYLMALFSGFTIANLLAFVFFGGGAWLMWWGKDFLRVEYEYSFTNGVVDVAQVINNRRRKDVISFRMRETDLVAPMDDPRFEPLSKRQDVTKLRAFLNVGAPLYFATFKKNEKTYLLYFEPSEELLKLMRMYNERNVTL